MAIDSLINIRPVVSPVSHSYRERDKQKHNKQNKHTTQEKNITSRSDKLLDGESGHVDERV